MSQNKKIMEKLKVLVVDDEPGIRSGVIRILKNYTIGFPFMEEERQQGEQLREGLDELSD